MKKQKNKQTRKPQKTKNNLKKKQKNAILNLEIHLKYFTFVLTFIKRLLLTLLWVSRPDVPLIISSLYRLSGNNCHLFRYRPEN